VIVTSFGERCNLAREGKMLVKDKAKISSRAGGDFKNPKNIRVNV